MKEEVEEIKAQRKSTRIGEINSSSRQPADRNRQLSGLPEIRPLETRVTEEGTALEVCP